MAGASRLRILVYGSVQGVFFRAGVQSEARRLNLVGWVRNLPDGSVEVMAEGEPGALETLLKWCSRGPEGASVSDVKAERAAASGEFRDFRVTS